MEAFDLLRRLGFSEYEAKAYVALLQQHPASGARVAKVSGIPRPNVYAVLQKLEEAGAALRVETGDGIEYSPVRPAELIERLSSEFEEVVHAARQVLDDIGSPVEDDYVRNLRGEPLLLQHAREIVNSAATEVLLAVSLPEAQALVEVTGQAEARGVAFTTLCLQACPQECGNCRGTIYRYPLNQAEDNSRWLTVIRDSNEIFVGAISREEVTGIRTKQRRLVEMTSWYIRHSIAVAQLLNDLGSQVDQLLNPITQAYLESGRPDARWLKSLLSLLHSGRSL
jgi:sugar-specific transcriptional regulator TrmB